MTKRNLSAGAAIAAALFLSLGIARASNGKFEQKRNALLQACDAERKKQGLNNQVALYAKYPTPEITMARIVRAAPDSTVEVVVRGKFVPGTKFLFDNDSVEVVQENATAGEYRATVRIGSVPGPSFSNLVAFTPVSGASFVAPAIYIGGKYEWDLTAQNGWRITLRLKDETFKPDSGSVPKPRYTAEFFRGSETKPFQTMEVNLDLASSSYSDNYGASLQGATGPAGDPMTEIQNISKRMSDPKITPEERQKLTARMMQLSQAMQAQMSDPNYYKKLQSADDDFGCKDIGLHLAGTAVDGEVSCGKNVGRLQLKGTVRYAGQ